MAPKVGTMYSAVLFMLFAGFAMILWQQFALIIRHQRKDSATTEVIMKKISALDERVKDLVDKTTWTQDIQSELQASIESMHLQLESQVEQVDTRAEWLQQSHIRGRQVPVTARGEAVPVGAPFEDSLHGCRRRYLIVGSAPYSYNWWQDHRDRVKAAGFVVVALSDAWKVVGVEDLDVWEVPEGFHAAGAVLPEDADLRAMRAVRLYREPGREMHARYIRGGSQANVTFLHIPGGYPEGGQPAVYYKKRGGGSMLLDSLYDIALIEEPRLNETCIVVTGCDWSYSRAPNRLTRDTSGPPDVFRFGKKWIDTELAHAQAQLERLGTRIFNAGYALNTKLKFDRIEMPSPGLPTDEPTETVSPPAAPPPAKLNLKTILELAANSEKDKKSKARG